MLTIFASGKSMQIKLVSALEGMSTASVLGIFNAAAAALSLKAVKKFADKATAVKRTEAVLGELSALPATKDWTLQGAEDGSSAALVFGAAPDADGEKATRTRVGDDQVVVLKATETVGRAGSLKAKRFELLKSGMSVGEFVTAVAGVKDAKGAVRVDKKLARRARRLVLKLQGAGHLDLVSRAKWVEISSKA